MADNLELQIGDQVFRVPRWATEETAKQMSKYNEASAKALTELLKTNSKGNKVVMENQKIFRDLKMATKRDQTEFIKSQEKLVDIQKTHGETLTKAGVKVKKAGDNLLGAFNKDSLSGIVSALIPIGALGAAAGFTVGVLENFSKNVANLTNVGVGLGVTLVDLRQQAAATGLNIEDYGKLVMSNGDALRALGENAQDGARRFSAISQQTRIMARDFNNFGLTNQEFNDLLLSEIEIRRRAGIEQERLADGVSDAFNNLMVETTAMAAITGQDRREMLRRRQELLSDPGIQAAQMAAAASGRTDFAENLGSITDAFGSGGDVGGQIGRAIALAVTQGRDFRAIQGGVMAPVAALNSEVGASLTEIQEFVRANRESMDPREFRSQLVTMLAQIPDLISPDEFQQLGLLATEGRDGAAELIDFIAQLNGLEKNLDTNRDAMDQAEQQLREAGVIALPATIQEMTNALKSSALTSVIDQLGLDVESTGDVLVESLRGITDNFGIDSGLWEGLRDSYSELTEVSDKLKHVLIGLAAAAGALSLTFGGRKLLGGLGRFGVKSLGKVASGVKSLGGRAAKIAGGFFGNNGVKSAGNASSRSSLFKRLLDGTKSMRSTASGSAGSSALAAGPLAAFAGTAAVLGKGAKDYKAFLKQYPELAATNNGAGPGLVQGKYLVENGLIENYIKEQKRAGTYKPPLAQMQPSAQSTTGQSSIGSAGTLNSQAGSGESSSQSITTMQQYLDTGNKPGSDPNGEKLDKLIHEMQINNDETRRLRSYLEQNS